MKLRFSSGWTILALVISLFGASFAQAAQDAPDASVCRETPISQNSICLLVNHVYELDQVTSVQYEGVDGKDFVHLVATDQWNNDHSVDISDMGWGYGRELARKLNHSPRKYEIIAMPGSDQDERSWRDEVGYTQLKRSDIQVIPAD